MKKIFVPLFYLIFSIAFFHAVGQVDQAAQSVQKENTIEILKAIKKKLRTIDQSDNTEKNKFLIKDCTDQINKGITFLSNNLSFVVSPEFNKALLGLAAFTDRIEKLQSTNRTKPLEQLSIDLKLKFSQRSGQSQATINSALVPTIIKALHTDGTEAKLFRVHYAPLGEEIDLSKQYEVYPTLTTPAVKSIIPGFYKFWLKKDGEQEIRSELDYEVTADGATIEMTVKNK